MPLQLQGKPGIQRDRDRCHQSGPYQVHSISQISGNGIDTGSAGVRALGCLRGNGPVCGDEERPKGKTSVIFALTTLLSVGRNSKRFLWWFLREPWIELKSRSNANSIWENKRELRPAVQFLPSADCYRDAKVTLNSGRSRILLGFFGKYSRTRVASETVASFRGEGACGIPIG